MAEDEYVSSRGGLKLKGGTGGRVEKKKKKKPSPSSPSAFPEKTIKPSSLQQENTTQATPIIVKTDAEKKFELIRRQRMDERLKDISSKSHKERVSDLNKYLGSLSDHMDLPKT
ncbi:Protein FAM32A [Neolecta irregularis DAH-3]|uniref:Protein FAM32A n=1 Tax=Neolecta irregularis (strain DAH-3) TaxID=1198029 RepID=A0A1U7LMT6_NEOID|nr:Protein FAM32A [Neolecta irregularis DAH-3]|eukprot:OLL23893.1 Protein FAM32A [Neolecta irregularis DAH-3]